MGNQKAKRQIWEARINAFQASGQTAVAWCEANDINRRQLYSWLRKQKRSSASPISEHNWVTVTADREQPSESHSSLVVRIGTAAIEVRPGFNTVLLRDIVQSLEALC